MAGCHRHPLIPWWLPPKHSTRSSMPHPRVSSVAAAALVLSLLTGADALAQTANDNKLDDATIVAIFDAANSWDIETKDHEAAVKKLSALSGAAFDRAFLEHEVAFHKAVLDAVRTTLLPALQNMEVKDLVTKVAPAFNAHMVVAQRLLDNLPK
jgi:predicted outer membrane protein